MSLGSDVDMVYDLFPLTTAALSGPCIVMHNKAKAKYMYMFTLSFVITKTRVVSSRAVCLLFFNCALSEDDPLAFSEHAVAKSQGAIKHLSLTFRVNIRQCCYRNNAASFTSTVQSFEMNCLIHHIVMQLWARCVHAPQHHVFSQISGS